MKKLLLVTCLLLTACGANIASEVTNTPSSGSETAAAVKTNDAAAFMTAEAAPTSTPRPTNTPAPTATHTPVPLPQISTGSGDDIVDLEPHLAGEIVFLVINYSGSRNFVIWGYDDLGERQDLLVNTIGSYIGERLANVRSSDNITRLQVESSGEWTIGIYPFEPDYILEYLATVSETQTVTSSGDTVLVILEDFDTVQVDATGKRNFVVWAYGENNIDLLFNEIAQYSGRTIMPNGTLILEIEATGAWEFTFE